MMTTLDDSLEHSLALDCACGLSVRAWARRNCVEFRVAYARSIENGFRELVDLLRLRIADRIVGRMTVGVRVAVNQLIRLCTKGKSDAIRLSAGRALLSYFVAISRHIHVKGMLRGLKEKIEKWEKTDPRSAWVPTPPYGLSPAP